MALDLEANGSPIYNTRLAHNDTMGMEKFRHLGRLHHGFPRRMWF